MVHRILIVDDSAPIRTCVRQCIEENTAWDVCGEAENGRMAVEQVGKLHPDVVILDLQMPVMDGLEAARQITGIAPDTAMVMFTSHESAQVVQAAKTAGIREVISKSEHLTDNLLAFLHGVAPDADHGNSAA